MSGFPGLLSGLLFALGDEAMTDSPLPNHKDGTEAQMAALPIPNALTPMPAPNTLPLELSFSSRVSSGKSAPPTKTIDDVQTSEQASALPLAVLAAPAMAEAALASTPRPERPFTFAAPEVIELSRPGVQAKKPVSFSSMGDIAFAARVTLDPGSEPAKTFEKSLLAPEPDQSLAPSRAALPAHPVASSPLLGAAPVPRPASGSAESNHSPLPPLNAEIARQPAGEKHYGSGAQPQNEPERVLPDAKSIAAELPVAVPNHPVKASDPVKAEAPPAPAAPHSDLPVEKPQPMRPPAEPLRELSLQLKDGSRESIAVRFVEQSGELRVAVRSADPELTRNLRQGLGELTSDLQRSGFHSETWKPSAESGQPAAEARQAGPDSQGRPGENSPDRQPGGRQHHGQPRHQQESPTRSIPGEARKSAIPQWLREIDSSLQENKS